MVDDQNEFQWSIQQEYANYYLLENSKLRIRIDFVICIAHLYEALIAIIFVQNDQANMA